MEGFEIPWIARHEAVINDPTGDKFLSGKSPDSAQKKPLGIVFQIEAVDPVSGRPGALRLTPPQFADMEEMLKGIETLPESIPESFHQSIRIMERLHIEKRVEIFVPQIRHVGHSVGHRGEPKSMALAKLAAIDRAILKLHDKSPAGIFLDIIFEKKGDIKVRAGCHLSPARATDRRYGERARETEDGLLLRRPPGDRPGENGSSSRDNRETIVEIRREDEGIVFRDESMVFPGLRKKRRLGFAGSGFSGAGWIGGRVHGNHFRLGELRGFEESADGEQRSLNQ